MPKPQNEARVNTTIAISKATKQKIRACAKPATERKGYETDAQIIERIFDIYIQNNNISVNETHSTY